MNNKYKINYLDNQLNDKTNNVGKELCISIHQRFISLLQTILDKGYIKEENIEDFKKEYMHKPL